MKQSEYTNYVSSAGFNQLRRSVVVHKEAERSHSRQNDARRALEAKKDPMKMNQAVHQAIRRKQMGRRK